MWTVPARRSGSYSIGVETDSAAAKSSKRSSTSSAKRMKAPSRRTWNAWGCGASPWPEAGSVRESAATRAKAPPDRANSR